MNDIGWLGNATLEGTQAIAVWCRNGSDVVSAPDADPTYTIYSADWTQIQTGTMTLNPGSTTGFQAVTESVTAARGYAVGNKYFVKIEYAISAVSYGSIGVFGIH